MIAKSIGITLLLFVIYSVLLHSNVVKNNMQGQDQWQANTIKAQEYLYAPTVPDNVIVGSSLSCRILSDSLPGDFYNLSFGGQSIFDGLEVLMHRPQFPKRVFIEMNMVKRGGDADFIKSLFNPVMFPLRKDISALRDKNQPSVCLLQSFVPFAGEHIYDPFTSRFYNPLLKKFNFLKGSTASVASSGSGLYAQVVKEEVDDFNRVPDSIDMHLKFSKLAAELRLLKENGTTIIFFEMPMHPELDNTVQMKTIRKLFLQYFPLPGYIYLDKPDYTAYSTGDGLHLNEDAAKKYTGYFVRTASGKIPGL
jgi:hypothetical protein